ncbi:MAG: hypothetical protein R3D85_15390 [Paracoccaceae bacterium]
MVISAKIEEEISQLDDDEAAMFLEEMGLAEAGRRPPDRAGYDLLNLETYFTVGPKGSPRLDHPPRHPGAAGGGRVHGDFERGFIPCRDHRL